MTFCNNNLEKKTNQLSKIVHDKLIFNIFSSSIHEIHLLYNIVFVSQYIVLTVKLYINMYLI